jgi:hypothetical protein
MHLAVLASEIPAKPEDHNLNQRVACEQAERLHIAVVPNASLFHQKEKRT